MPEVTYTADGGHYRVGGHGFDPGDTQEVEQELADYLSDVDEFEVVDADASPDQEDEPPDETEAGAGDDAAPDEFDVGTFLDRTPVKDVADDIRAGDVDEHLEAIDEEASRVTVQDAIGERRAELEG